MQGYFVTGTDTDAGKTTVTAALSVLLGREGSRPLVIKPVQTGCLKKGQSLLVPDVACVQSFGGEACALHCYEPPCSPHLAADLAGEKLCCHGLACEVREKALGRTVLVEGAGGLHVPLNESEDMLDLMQALGLPAVLVVANKLGCLNHARLSLEAMQARGLDVAGMVLIRTLPDTHYDAGCGAEAVQADEERILSDNVISLKRMGEALSVPLLADIPYLGDPFDREALLLSLQPAASVLQEKLDAQCSHEKERAEDLAFDREHLWHPYTSASKPLPVFMVRSAHDNKLVLDDGRELIDGMSSWWCAVHGYGNDRLKKAMQRQLAVMSHVMFGGITHKPAIDLARRLIPLVPEGLDHLFYADSGSVSVEVALKMAVQYQISKGRPKRQKFLTPMGGYHGDTQGAMSVCDPVTGMHTLFNRLLPDHLFMERPACRFDKPFDPASLDDAIRFLKAYGDEIAAVILEPVVQGAGGMWFYHPDYLKGLYALCKERDILLIADEIATGFGRTGRLFACEWAGITPDICCLGKALTGGMMTGAVTMCTANVAQGIGAADEEHGGGILMHGPTFMANPLFCAAALASIDELMSSPWQERVLQIEARLKEGLSPLRSHTSVRDVRVLGAIGVVETAEPVNMRTLQAFFVEHGVWIRPFNHLIYLMPPFVTPMQDIDRLCAAVRSAVQEGCI